MNVCILRGPRAEQSVIDGAIALLKGRGVEGWEADRDGPATAITGGLKDTALVVTLGGDGTFLAGARLAAAELMEAHISGAGREKTKADVFQVKQSA